MKKITPCLWFDTQAEEAANFYTSIFPNSKIKDTSYYDDESAKVSGMPSGSVLVVSFEINGQPFMALNGGPVFKFTEATSFEVGCDDQAEVDRLWEALSAHPESEQCGWLKDKYGVSWQITPTILGELLSDPDPHKASRVMKAMLGMKKIDISKLKEAAEEK